MYIFPGRLCEYGLEYGLSYWVTCITCDPLFLHTVPSSIFDFRSANNKRPAVDIKTGREVVISIKTK